MLFWLIHNKTIHFYNKCKSDAGSGQKETGLY